MKTNKKKIFRIVDTSTGEVIPSHKFWFSFDEDSGEVVFLIKEKYKFYKENKKFIFPFQDKNIKEDFRLDEWTGMCDGNGVKIFENDIVEYREQKNEREIAQSLISLEKNKISQISQFKITWNNKKSFFLENTENKNSLQIGIPYLRSWERVFVIGIFIG